MIMKNSIRKTVAAFSLSCFLGLAGCASGGNESIKNETAASVAQKIHDGVTTKEQVRALFGDPAQTGFTDSGHEQWQYAFTDTHDSAMNFIPLYGDLKQTSHGTEKTLSIIFNGDVVWHHAMSASKTTMNAGVLH